MRLLLLLLLAFISLLSNYAFADFAGVQNYRWDTRSGCVSNFTSRASVCAADSCEGKDTSLASNQFECSLSEKSCTGTQRAYVWRCAATSITCPANSTLVNGNCQCATDWYERVDGSQQYYCSQTTSFNDNLAMGVIAANIGLSLASMTGLFAGIASCLSAIVCAAGLALGAFGSAVAAVSGLGMLLSDSGTSALASGGSDPCANKTCIQVRINDNSKNISGAAIGSAGAVKASDNSTIQSDGTYLEVINDISQYTNQDKGTVTNLKANGGWSHLATNSDGSVEIYYGSGKINNSATVGSLPVSTYTGGGGSINKAGAFTPRSESYFHQVGNGELQQSDNPDPCSTLQCDGTGGNNGGNNGNNGGNTGGSVTPGTSTDPGDYVDDDCISASDCAAGLGDASLGTFDVPVSWNPTSWGSNSTCPADKVLSLSHGKSLTITYKPICDGLTMLKPVLILASTILGVFIIVGFKKEA